MTEHWIKWLTTANMHLTGAAHMAFQVLGLLETWKLSGVYAGALLFFFWGVCFHESMATCKDDWMLPVISDGCILTLVCSVFRYIGYLPFDYLAAQTLNTKVFYIFKLCDTGFFVNI